MYNRLNNENPSDKNLSDAGKTETNNLSSAPVSGSYGSTPARDGSTPPEFYVPSCGLVFYVMAFFGFVSALIVRECLSVAIVAMVNQTAVAEEDEDIVVVANVTEDQCPRDPELLNVGGKFRWSRNKQAFVLAAFYYGHGFSQVSGGWIADHFGGKWLFGGSVLLSSVVALMTPDAARKSIVLLIILRVLSGVGESVMLPANHSLIARWSAPKYRSIVVTVIYSGTEVGIIVGMLLTGVLCDYGFAGGWPSAFYVFGAFGCVWAVAWFLLCYNSPFDHPRISAVERKYWETVIGAGDLVACPPTPWREIFTSVPVWALTTALFASHWSYFTFVTCLPLFMHDVLGFNMTRNGAYSALPFVASLITLPVCGFFADWLRSPGRLSTNLVRKIFSLTGFTLTGGFLILAGHIECNRFLAVTIMVVLLATINISRSTAIVNQLDLAPLHAGKIMGLTFAVANFGAIAGPHVVGLLTDVHSTRSRWQEVFSLAAGINFFAAVIFAHFGSGYRQPWAGDGNIEAGNTIDRNAENLTSK